VSASTTDTTRHHEPGRAARGGGNASRQFWRYWTASTVSNVGTAVTSVAMPLAAVLLLHASSLQVGMVTGAEYLAWLLVGLPAGVIVHRLPLRQTQVCMDLLRAAALLSVPIVAWLGHLTVAQLVAVALFVGLANVIFDVGNSTFIASVVSRDELTARNSLMSASHAVTQTGGPSIGGLLVAGVGAATSLLTDAASYLVSAVLLQGLPRAAAPPDPRAAGASLTRQIRDGLRWVARHPVIRPCVLDATLLNFVCGGLLTLTPVYLVRVLGASTGMVGLLIATDGVGSLLGASLTPRLVRRFGSARALLVGLAAALVMALFMPLAGHGWGLLSFALGNAGFAAGVVVSSIVTRSHRQAVTPPELLPRVMATVRFVSWGAIPFGAVLTGLAASALSVRTALWLIMLVVLADLAVMLTSRVRSLRELTDLDA
jgi:MFS family permease